MDDRAKTEAPTTQVYAYRAFISYSHRDKAVATRLHHTVESYRIPAKLVGTGFEVAVPVFVESGDKIEIDTRTHEYRKRA